MARINWSVFRNVLLTIVMSVYVCIPKVQNNPIFNLFVVTLLRYQVYFGVVVLAEAYLLILFNVSCETMSMIRQKWNHKRNFWQTSSFFKFIFSLDS